MAVDASYVKKQLSRLGDFKRWTNRPEIGFLPKIMEKDERLLGLTVSLHNEKKWLFSLTDRRIILIHRKLFDAESDYIPHDRILCFNEKKGFLFSRIDISTSLGKRSFDSIIKKDASRITLLMRSECNIEERSG